MNKILVVIDYQYDFVDGALGFIGAEKLDDLIHDRVREYLENGDVVIYTQDTHFEDYLDTREGKNLPIPHTIMGSKGWELYGKTGELLKNSDAIPIMKYSFGISPENMLELPFDDVNEIEICGIITNMCVISNAVTFQSRFPNAQLIVNGSLCASNDEALHNEALHVMESMQIKII